MVARREDMIDLPDWPRLLSRAQAAAYCSVSPNSFDTYFTPHLTEIRLGRAVRYDRNALDLRIDILQRGREGCSDPAAALEAL